MKTLKSRLEASVSFMADLQKNNVKEWFDSNRDRYTADLRDPLKELAHELTGPVSTLMADFSGNVKISRINNDVRFHPDKPPYKRHMWLSFGGREVADPFASVGEEGWSTGIMISAQKREGLDSWRRNLIENTAVWQNWSNAVEWSKELRVWTGDSYKRPLYDNIPEAVYTLVQAKALVIYRKNRERLPADPVVWFADGVAVMLPLYLMATSPPKHLGKRLDELNEMIPPLGPMSREVFEAVKGL
jgi:uncharacterized protein (TIGR02453 family)